MNTAIEHSNIREKLHDYIEKADEKKLWAIYTILEDEIEEYFSATIKVDQEIARYLPYLSMKQLKVVLELIKIFAAKNKGLRKKVN